MSAFRLLRYGGGQLRKGNSPNETAQRVKALPLPLSFTRFWRVQSENANLLHRRRYYLVNRTS